VVRVSSAAVLYEDGRIECELGENDGRKRRGRWRFRSHTFKDARNRRIYACGRWRDQGQQQQWQQQQQQKEERKTRLEEEPSAAAAAISFAAQCATPGGRWRFRPQTATAIYPLLLTCCWYAVHTRRPRWAGAEDDGRRRRGRRRTLLLDAGLDGGHLQVYTNSLQ